MQLEEEKCAISRERKELKASFHTAIAAHENVQDQLKQHIKVVETILNQLLMENDTLKNEKANVEVELDSYMRAKHALHQRANAPEVRIQNLDGIRNRTRKYALELERQFNKCKQCRKRYDSV